MIRLTGNTTAEMTAIQRAFKTAQSGPNEKYITLADRKNAIHIINGKTPQDDLILDTVGANNMAIKELLLQGAGGVLELSQMNRKIPQRKRSLPNSYLILFQNLSRHSKILTTWNSICA